MKKTFCKRGHELIPENVYKTGQCKLCMKARYESQKEYQKYYYQTKTKAKREAKENMNPEIFMKENERLLTLLLEAREEVGRLKSELEHVQKNGKAALAERLLLQQQIN